MKKIILLTFLAIQLSLTAQDFFPIPVDTTSVWRISRQHNDETCVFHYNSIYYINGTVIKWGKEYYKVYEEGYFWTSDVDLMNPCNIEGYHYSGVYRGAIRTENKKTYGFTPTYSSPALLMDFTLDVGDTMYSSICEFGKVIVSIDSVLVGDEYRKRFNFDDEWDYCNWMIEGIGHQRGLFESMDEPFENSSNLICYGENGIPIFGNENCDITVGKAENLCQIKEIKIYPNPTKSKFNYIATNSHIIKLNIYNNLGQKVLTEYHPSNTIDISSIKQGFYIVEFVTSKTKIKKKLIIE